MPISSTQVSNIIGGQIGMFSASAQYSQAISAQYGFQPGGAPFPNDPFQQNQMQQNLAVGGSMANTVAGAGQMGMGAVSLAAMFGAAPRMFDPFTMGAHAFRGGMASGGMMGGLASGALAFGGVSAGIGAVGYGLNQMQTGVQNRMMLTQQAGQMMPGMGVGGLNAVAGQIESMNRQGMGSLQELTGLMRQGANSGTLNTSSLNDFTMSFQKLVTNVRQVATALNSTMSQAQQAMQEVKAMGISSDNAAGFLGTARAFGAQVGMGPQQMMQYASMGSSFAANAGIHRAAGATGAITQAGVYGLANRQGIAGVLPDSYQRYMGGASRFLGSRQGRAVLGAMLDVNTGGINMQVARQISAGGMTRQQINTLSQSNIANYGRDAFEASRGELGASFISEFGPQGLGRTIGDMTANSANPQQLRQRLTGLNRADFMGMQNLQGQTDRLTSELVNAAKDGFKQGQNTSGFSDHLRRVFDDMVKPVKDHFRQMGAGLAKSMQEAVGQFTGEFSAPTGPGHISSAGMRSAFRRQHVAATFGGDSAFMDVLQQQSSLLKPKLGFNFAPGGIDDDPTMMQSLARRLPAGLRIGSYGPGTTFSDLPMNGFGTEQYSGTQTAIALGMRPGGAALGALGRGMFSVGGEMAGFMNTVAPSSGFMGMGGRGLLGGTGMGIARATQGLGLMGRGLGAAARFAAPAAMAYDFTTNILPEMRRQTGAAPISAGGITGQQADYVNFLAENTNFFAQGGIREMTSKEFYDLDESVRRDMTPVGGFIKAPTASGGTVNSGTQRFLTGGGRDRLVASGGPGAREGAAGMFKEVNGKPADLDQARDAIRRAVGKLKANMPSGNGRLGWDAQQDSEKLFQIQRQLHDDGHTRVTSGDVVQVIDGVRHEGKLIFSLSGTLSNAARNSDPAAARENVAAQLGREMTAHMYAAHLAGDKRMLNSLDPSGGRQTFMKELQELGAVENGRSLVSRALVNDSDSDSVKRVDGRDMIPENQLANVDFTEVMPTGSQLKGNATRREAIRQGSIPDADMQTRVSDAINTFSRSGSAAVEASTNNAFRAGLAQLVVQSENQGFRDQAGALSRQYMRAGSSDKDMRANALSQFRRLLMEDSRTRGALQEGSVGSVSLGTGTVGDDMLASLLDTRGDQGNLGKFLQMEGNLRASDNYYSELDRRRNYYYDDQNKRRITGGLREAAEMSGANSRFMGIAQSAVRRFYTGEGDKATRDGGRAYSDSPVVAGRQELMDALQIRLRGADNINPAGGAQGLRDELNAAIEKGGAMDMNQLDRLGAELLEENDPALRDMGQMVTNMARFRRASRTQGGMGRGRSRQHVAEKVLGLRFKGSSREEDLKFIAGDKGAVMSMNLESQLRTMARSALSQAMPGQEPSDEQIEQKMGRITAALRKKDAQDMGYEELNQVMNTVSPPRDPNSAAPSGRDGSRTAANMGDLNTVTEQFVKNVARMNGAMNGQSTQDPNSDIRLKWDITKVGKSPSGIPLYTFRYKDDPEAKKYNGAMAQDLLKLAPDAVLVGEDDYYRVRYDLIDVGFYQINEGTK